MSKKPDKGYSLERMLFFSDGVIAIAITLLALELPIPEANGLRELVAALSANGREYAAFLIAFALVGGSWIAHHALFAYVEENDNGLMLLNLGSLLAFVLVPWASKSLSASEGGAGLAVFSAVMMLLTGSLPLLARHADRAGLLRANTPAGRFREAGIMAGIPALTFALSIPLAFLVGWWVVPVWIAVYAGVIVYTARTRQTA